jgi:hypothetical protein
VTLDALGLVSRNTLILASSKITFSVLLTVPKWSVADLQCCHD